MSHHYATNENAGAVIELLRALPQANPLIAGGVIVGIAGEEPREGQGGGRGRGGSPGGWPEEKPPALTAEQRTALAQVYTAVSPELQAGLARIATRWGMPDLFGAR
jgi:hypothetical protein